MKKQRKQEFVEHRTSYKWFENRYSKQYDIADQMKTLDSFQTRLFIEILKELQYLNDRKV